MEKPQKPEQKYCNYLEAVRQTGKINMFGAASYLAEAFGLNLSQARSILMDWMNTYEMGE